MASSRATTKSPPSLPGSSPGSRRRPPEGRWSVAQDDVGGLKVKRKSDGNYWIRVKPTLDTYVIDVGDIIQVDQCPKFR